MASLSLPRVLQLKKNSVDNERENFEKFQSLAINKAINSQETPVKEKHVRSTIIGSFQEQGAVTFWVVAGRLPLQENRIIAWKFCHVLHKLLREGHPACLDDSQRHIGMIESIGRLWMHLREGYGRLIQLYCSLLMTKLKFHARNPRFPGNMTLTSEELDAIAENDVNNYFQICVELFDYMDEILNLQEAVFESLGNARANSMTASGQCRLAALIPCAQDSSHIYDCNVRLLFRLHAALPADTLSGHRDRFRQNFKKLSQFYKTAGTMQYFRNLLTLPQLPPNPPNFLLQSDFGTYIPPVVVIPEQSHDETDAIGSLIDTSDTISQFSVTTSPDNSHHEVLDNRLSPSPPQPDVIIERDRLIEHLQNELKRMRGDVSQLINERSSMMTSMRDHCTKLENELTQTKSQLDAEKQKTTEFITKTPEITNKLTETETKLRVTDEKFQKLKSAYTQLRDEHIALIRQKAEIDKMAAQLRASAAEHESAKVALQQQLNDKMRDVEILQQSASSTAELDALREEITTLRADLTQSKQREVELSHTLEDLKAQHSSYENDSNDKLSRVENQLKEISEKYDLLMKEKNESDEELKRVKDEVRDNDNKRKEEIRNISSEKDSLLLRIDAIKDEHAREKQALASSKDCVDEEIKVQNEKLLENQETIVTLQNKINDLTSDLEAVTDKLRQTETDMFNFELNAKKCEDNSLALKGKLDILSKENDELKQEIEMISADNFMNLDKWEEVELVKQEQIEKIQLLEESLDNLEIQYKIKESEHKNKISHLNCKVENLTKELDDIREVISEQEAQFEIATTELTNLESENNNLEDKQFKEVFSLKTDLKRVFEEKLAFLQMIEELRTNEKELEEKNQELQESLAALEIQYKIKESEKNKRITALKEEIGVLKTELNEIKDVIDEQEAQFEIATSELVKIEKEQENYETDQHKEMFNLKKEMKRILDEKIQTSKMFRELKVEKEDIIKMYEDTNSKLETLSTLINEKDIRLIEKNDETVKLKKQIAIMVETEDEKDKIYQEELAKIHEKTNSLLTESKQEKECLECRLESCEELRLTAECELQDLLQQNITLEKQLTQISCELDANKKEVEIERVKLLECATKAALEMLACALKDLDKCETEPLTAASELTKLAFNQLGNIEEVKGNEQKVAKEVLSAAHNVSQLNARTSEMSNSITDSDKAEKLSSDCRKMLEITKQCVETVSEGRIDAKLCSEVCGYVSVVDKDIAGVSQVQDVGSVDDQLADMDKAIEDAATRIEEILAASRSSDKGVKLEVNEKILDACTTLMAAVKMLVRDARKLQSEIGDKNTRKNLYRKNPQWSEGLISAAKAVVVAAKLLVSSADAAVSSTGSGEAVAAASHEVAGATAQLVSASRARAPPGAAGLAALSAASRQVAHAAGAVLAAVRAAAALTADREDLDTSALSLTATRRLEMESKVRSLELEAALDNERARLAALRRRHYQLALAEETGKSIPNGNH